MAARAQGQFRLWRWGLALVLLAALAYAAGFVIFAETLPRQPPALDRPDAIVALTGGGSRLDTAVTLLEHGVGRRLLITGVNTSTTRPEIKKLAHGGPRFDCCVDLGRSAANTHGNATEAAQWSRVHGYRRLLIVTASYHMPRSLTEFSAEMPHVALEAYPVEPDGVDLRQWWRDPRAFKLLQSEYAKYLAALVLTHTVSDAERRAIDPSVARLDGTSGAAGG